MHDIKDIRQNPDKYKQGLQARGKDPSTIDTLLEMDKQVRATKTEVQTAQAEVNRYTSLIQAQKQAEKMEQKVIDYDLEIARLKDKVVAFDQQALEILQVSIPILEEICKEVVAERS